MYILLSNIMLSYNSLSLSHAPATELECCCGRIRGMNKGAFYFVPDEKFVKKQPDWEAG